VAKLSSNRSRFALDAAVSEANHAVTRRLPGRVACSVPLECCPVAVELPAVRLDDQASARPVGVDLVIEDMDVGEWKRQPVLPTQLHDAILERRAGHHRRSGLLDQATNWPERSPPVTPIADGFQRWHLQQAQPVRFLEGPFEVLEIHNFGKVEQSSRHRGDRDAVDFRSIFPVNASFVDGDAGTTTAIRRRNVDRARPVPHQAPERRRAAMTEQCSLSTSQDRRKPLSPPAQCVPSQPVDPLMQTAELAPLDSPFDRAIPKTRIEQLRTSDDTMLRRRQIGQPPFTHGDRRAARLPLHRLPPTCRRFPAHMGG